MLKRCIHIRNGQNIKGFRSCKHSTGAPLFYRERGKIMFEEEKLEQKKAERLWLTSQYQKIWAIRLGLNFK
jgi:hypothetical protein